MAENVRKSFEETIKNAQWLDETTREEAISKVKKIELVISHEKWVENLQEIENKYADVSRYFENIFLGTSVKYSVDNGSYLNTDFQLLRYRCLEIQKSF